MNLLPLVVPLVVPLAVPLLDANRTTVWIATTSKKDFTIIIIQLSPLVVVVLNIKDSE